MKKKIQKKYHDHGFGFPVTILNVPMIQVRGEWVPDINQQELQSLVVEALVLKHCRLSGNEIHFIRLFSEMTLKQFAERFDVSHPAVMKWEKAGNGPTGMNWTTEKDIRLFALKKINPKPKNFIEVYERLSAVATLDSEAIEIDMEKIAA
jgi:DNA-binding transcriptional regulator YiaG